MSAELTIVKSSHPIYAKDLGRWGQQRFGIGPGGAADTYAQRWSNTLLSNTLECSSLEICLGNCEFTFSQATRAAISGADCKAKLNGQALTNWTSFTVQAGDRLQFAMPTTGIYSYLGVKHGFIIDRVLGSSSINAREHIGPNKGDGFTSGTSIAYKEYNKQKLRQSLHWSLCPRYDEDLSLRIIPSALSLSNHIDWNAFAGHKYAVQADSNKMGIRLSGKAITLHKPHGYSEGVVEGCVQIPDNGQPIILMAEHQTIGGYPLLGCAYAVDIPRLAQRRPGQAVSLTKGSIEQAQQCYQQQHALFERLRSD